MHGHEHFNIDHYLRAQADPLILLMNNKVAEVQFESTFEIKDYLNVYRTWKHFVDTLVNSKNEKVPLRSWWSKNKGNEKEITLFVRRAS